MRAWFGRDLSKTFADCIKHFYLILLAVEVDLISECKSLLACRARLHIFWACSSSSHTPRLGSVFGELGLDCGSVVYIYDRDWDRQFKGWRFA